LFLNCPTWSRKSSASRGKCRVQLQQKSDSAGGRKARSPWPSARRSALVQFAPFEPDQIASVQHFEPDDGSPADRRSGSVCSRPRQTDDQGHELPRRTSSARSVASLQRQHAISRQARTFVHVDPSVRTG
jgi:hypothetical protein